MNKLSRIIIFFSSMLVFISIFFWYINPDWAWYKCTLVRFLRYTVFKIRIFNTGCGFTFKNKFLSDEKIIKALFTNPSYMSVILQYVPILILTSNILLLTSTIMNCRRLGLFSSIGLLTLIIFMSLSINLLVKENIPCLHIEIPTLLAFSAALVGTAASLFPSSKR